MSLAAYGWVRLMDVGSFSYQVSQLILAHVTKSPFPYWNGMMVYSLFGAIDANSGWLFGR